MRTNTLGPCMYVYYCRTYEKAVSGGEEREKGGHVLPAAACTFESGHLTLVSGAGEGEVVSKKEVRRGLAVGL